jgi:hypothetical protein
MIPLIVGRYVSNALHNVQIRPKSIIAKVHEMIIIFIDHPKSNNRIFIIILIYLNEYEISSIRCAIDHRASRGEKIDGNIRA